MKTFSKDALRAARKAAGYTQKALGEAVGTTEQHLQQWEYGKVEPSASYLLRMMFLLNCSPQDLLTEEPTE